MIYPLPIAIDYPHPQEIGTDRLVNACAASQFYDENLILVDLGTATTFCVLHKMKKKKHSYIGGAIAPGIYTTMDTLNKYTAQLPSFEFAYPEKGVVGKSTIEALQSGFYFSCTGLIREILQNIKNENPDRNYMCIATGGLASTIFQHSTNLFDAVDPFLTIKGLKIIYKYLVKKD